MLYDENTSISEHLQSTLAEDLEDIGIWIPLPDTKGWIKDKLTELVTILSLYVEKKGLD